MKQTILSILIILLLGVPSSGLSPGYTQDSQAQAPFSLDISAPNLVVAIGSKAMINVVLTNVSDHFIAVHLDNSGDSLFSGYQAHAYSSANKHCKMTERAWNLSFKKPAADDTNGYHGYKDLIFLGSGGWGPLKPGLTKETSFDLFEAYSLSPGRYTVWVSLADPASKAVVKSNTLTITVTGTTK